MFSGAAFGSYNFMCEYDEQRQELTLKAAYYGPALSGKTTNLISLHDSLSSEHRGDLLTLDTDRDRTMFFDLLPFFFITSTGLRVKVKAYTVPGQVRYDSTRKMLLSQVDGIVFVADSQNIQQFNNCENFSNLEENCKVLGIDLKNLPLVIQYNKRDLTNIISEEEVHKRWNQSGLPIFFASALYNVQVKETFRSIMTLIYRSRNAQLQLAEKHGLDEELFLQNFMRYNNAS